MTQLCAIPGCRIRHRHLDACDDADCGGCLPRTTDEGLVCEADVARADRQLAEIITLAPDARLVAAGLVHRGDGGAGGKPASRPPLNDGATDTLDEVTNALTTTVRDIAETRGLQIASAGRTPTDPLIRACSWLSGQMKWLRHAVDDQGGPYAATVFAEIGQNAARLRRLVDGPAPQRYLGPCGAAWDIGTMDDPDRTLVCEGDVYARDGASAGRCRACGAEWSTAERRAWLDGEVRAHAFRAAHIAQAYGVSADTIRTWSTRVRPDTGEPALASYWRTAGGLVTPWAEPVLDPDLTGDERVAREAEIAAELEARGPRLHYVGDVLDLAAASAARRETERAKRERRAATRAAEHESEDAA